MGRKKQPPLVDFYSKQFIRVWLAYDREGDFEEVGEDDIGERPEWLQWELENMGWGDFIGIGWKHSAKDEDGNDFNESILLWGLENGIAPGQPFLLEMDHPHYSTSHTENGTEHDVDYSCEILRVIPWHLKKVASIFEKWRDEEMDYREAVKKQRRKEKHLQRSDVKSMFITTDVYFGSKQSYWDDMCMPNGIRYTLHTNASLDKRKHWVTGQLASGDDDDGDHEKAMAALVADVLKRLPGLTPEMVKAMPRRRGGW